MTELCPDVVESNDLTTRELTERNYPQVSFEAPFDDLASFKNLNCFPSAV